MEITTLIPAFKSKYISQLLHSLNHQTIKPQRIIVSDDSPHGEYNKIFNELSAGSGLNIEYSTGPKSGGFKNIQHLINLWDKRSELVHIFLDDDVIFPNFYERHIVAHNSASLSCSISARWQSSDIGLMIAAQSPPKIVQDSPFKILSLDSSIVIGSTIAESKNWFGEFSNAIIKNDACTLLLDPKLGNISYAGLWDLGFFVSASLLRPIGYIQDYLGYFRLGNESNSAQINGSYMKAAFAAYAALALGAKMEGLINEASAKICYERIHNFISYHYSDQMDMIKLNHFIGDLVADKRNSENAFLTEWHGFLLENKF